MAVGVDMIGAARTDPDLLGASLAATERPRPPAPAAVPRPFGSPVGAWLEALRARHEHRRDGAVASYIPELAKVDPEAFAISVVTVDGARYDVGDTDVPFTLQSLSKPLVYALVLDALGEEVVRRHIGVEPSGDAFNAITLTPGSGIALNAMVNAGAITAAGLVPGADDTTATANLLGGIERFAGRTLAVDEAVYRSERDTGHRNRAIAHLLRSTGALAGDGDAVVERYFRQCAVTVRTRDLALIAGTLANGGRNPVTGVRAASESTVRSVLSVMATCGMYDGAGEWMFTVGLPAKSGVSGGILAVLPGQLGIGVFSPRLDARGNSVRGVAVCRDLSERLGLHLVGSARPAADRIRRRTDIAYRRSKRLRGSGARRSLDARGTSALVFELQGDCSFAAVEAITRDLAAREPIPTAVVLDLERVTSLDPLMAPLLADIAIRVAEQGHGMVWSSVRDHGTAVEATDRVLLDRHADPLPRFLELDAAIEWAEDQLLSATQDAIDDRVEVAEHEVLLGLSPAALERVEQRLERQRWAAGDVVVARGEPADALLLIVRGTVSVTVPRPGIGPRRLATLSAGMTVGELSFLGGEERTADVVADTDVEVRVLHIDRFRELQAIDPSSAGVLLENLLAILARTARRMTDEIALLAS